MLRSAQEKTIQDKSEEKQSIIPMVLSDDEVIAFINDNSWNGDALLGYFSALREPLTSPILTLKIMRNDVAYNFLYHIALLDDACFAKLIELATPDAINAALMEDRADNALNPPLYGILKAQQDSADNVTQLFKKASSDAIDIALTKKDRDEVPTFLAFMLLANQEIVCSVIKKASQPGLSAAALMNYNGANALHLLLKSGGAVRVLKELCFRLDTKTMDQLMSLPRASDDYTPYHVLVERQSEKQEEVDQLAAIVINSMSPAAVDKLAKLAMFSDSRVNSLFCFIVYKRSQFFVDVIMSKWQDDTKMMLASAQLDGINALMIAIVGCSKRRGIFTLPDKNIADSAFSHTVNYILAHLSAATIVQLVVHSVDADELVSRKKGVAVFNKKSRQFLEGNPSARILEIVSERSPSFLNQVLRELLQEGVDDTVTKAMIYRMSSQNLSIFLAQHPMMPLTSMKNLKGFSSITNWRYKEGYLARLDEAEKILNANLVCIGELYVALNKADVMVNICVEYLGIEKAFIDRFNDEKQKTFHPEQAAEAVVQDKQREKEEKSFVNRAANFFRRVPKTQKLLPEKTAMKEEHKSFTH